jgi:putative membrane protein
MNPVRAILPRDAFNRFLVAVFLLLWAVSCIRLPHPQYFLMQHVPTIVAVVALLIADKRWQINRLGYALIVAFLILHVIGARYLYSNVPYDDWSQAILGVRISDALGFTRNHYDRFVHFCFGLLLIQPLWTLLADHLGLNKPWSAVLSFSVVLGASAAYEIIEWSVAMVFAPDWADAYNGQQGDVWDPQRDMTLAALGALISIGMMVATRRLPPRSS